MNLYVFRFFWVGTVSVSFLLSTLACVKHPQNPLVQECREENLRLKIELTQKNERLRQFNQLNDKNDLRSTH